MNVIETERSWNYLVLHGDDAFQSGWLPSFVTKKQASRLVSLIARSPFRDEATELLRVLNARIRE